MPHVVRAYVPGHSIATVYVLLRSSVHAYQSFIIRENIFSGYNSAHDFAHLFDVDTIERDVVVLEPEKIRAGFSFAALQILDTKVSILRKKPARATCSCGLWLGYY